MYYVNFLMMFKKIKNFFYLLFWGLKGGDTAIFGGNDSSSSNMSIVQTQNGGVMSDILQEKVTLEVEELRDKNYRVYREANKYDTSTLELTVNEDGEINGFKTNRLNKKSLNFFRKHIPVYGEANSKIITIQDNKIIQKSANEMPTGEYDYFTTINIIRDGFTPRFELEKFTKKVVVREDITNNDIFVDFYIPSEASQFGKIDAIFISNIAQMSENKNYRSDIIEFSEINWISEKAWGVDDICLFAFIDPQLINIDKFDGSFVLTFKCNMIKNGQYIPEKYKTKSLDEKYEQIAPKSDIFIVDTSVTQFNNNSNLITK